MQNAVLLTAAKQSRYAAESVSLFFLQLEQEETEKTERAFFLRFLCFLLLNSK
jgi:hypothetical protein